MRLFAAVDPDPAARAAAARAARAVAPRLDGGRARRMRWVAPERLHVTLRFLGEVPEADVGAVRGVFRTPFETAAFTAAVSGPGCFPAAGPPRVVWLGVGEGREALAAVRAELDGRLAAAGHPPEARPFSAHLTLGRMRGRPARSRLDVVRALSDVRIDAPRWVVDRVVLYESRPPGRGARYVALESTPLGCASGGGPPAGAPRTRAPRPSPACAVGRPHGVAAAE